METIKLWAATLALFLVWDWAATAYMRYVATSADWAVAANVFTTLLWYWGIRMVTKDAPLAMVLAGVAVGTWGGLRWP